MKKGDKGAEVKALQTFLNQNGANLVVDGHFGRLTEKAVIEYQKANNLPTTGQMELPTSGNRIIKMLLKSSQYVTSKSDKTGVCLHHTASGGDAEAVVKVWNRDDRGRVATHFVVGADGKIIQCMPLENWAYHIALGRMGKSTGANNNVNKSYIGIEICNWGYLEEKNGIFYNYVNRAVPAEEVVTLDKPFRGYRHWHKYTEEQVTAVKWLLNHLKDLFGFEYEKDIPYNASWLDLSWAAFRGKRVLTTHTNFEDGKADCSPQPNFFKMLP